MGGCSSYRACIEGPAALNTDTRLHTHKEDNVPFPAAMALEERLSASTDSPTGCRSGTCSPFAPQEAPVGSPPMGNLGGGEILVLLLVGLLVLGPERLPAAVRQMGKVLHQVRKVTVGFQEELRSAVEDPIVDVKASLGGETSLRSAPGTGAPKPGSENPQAGPEKSEDQATEPETDGD